MVHTTQQSASIMKGLTPPSRSVSVQGPNWNWIPGGASQIVATSSNPDAYCSSSLDSGDGTIYVLSNGASPDGQGDNYIWEGDGQGNWCNLPGLATQLAVDPNGILYAVNAAGSIYQWNGSAWTGIAGSASAITAASDGSIYVLSNANGSGDEAIWHYSGGTWTWVPGSGVSIDASWDTNTYTTPGGTIAPGGFYILTSQGYIYYGSSNGSSYTGLPGQAAAASEIQVQNGGGSGGGLFALSYPASSQGTPLYYYDLNNNDWTGLPGSGTSLAAVTLEANNPWTSTLYLVSGNGGIYWTTISAATTPASPHPAATGDTFRFTGTLSQTVTYSYPTNSPEPGTSQTASVTQNITVTSTPCPSATGNVSFSCSGQTDFHDAEVDAYTNESLYPTTDAWYALNGSNDWELFGMNVSDGSGDTFETSYGGTPYILDELPETQGASWTNTGASQYREVDADNSVTEQQINADGSYALTQIAGGGYGLGITTSATGASTYAGGCVEAISGVCTGAFSPLGAFPNTCASTTSGAPCGSLFEAFNSDYYGIVVQAPSGGTITVDVQKTPHGASPAPSPSMIATPHAWYTPLPGSVLYSESDSIPETNATLPGACNVPNSFGTTGNEIQQQIESIDPMVGFVSNETINVWIVAGFGPVCVQLSDIEDEYYNWTADTGRDSGGTAGADWVSVFSPLGASTGTTPASVETITETLTLQAASGSDVSSDLVRHTSTRTTSTVHAAASSTQSSGSTLNVHALTTVEVGYARARFDTMVRHVRVQRLKAFENTMAHLMNGGGNQ